MLDVYPVCLKLGWKHSVSCVSRTSQTRNTHHRRRCSRRRACHDWCGSRRTNGQQRLGHELVLGLGSGRDAAGTRPRSGLGLAAGGIAACLPRHCAPSDVKLILVLCPQYTLYLCIWLCIWCVSASKTETHRYTRIRTPHPVYLTSRPQTHIQAGWTQPTHQKTHTNPNTPHRPAKTTPQNHRHVFQLLPVALLPRLPRGCGRRGT